MTAYGPPATPRPPASPDQRAMLMSYVAGGLGVLSFIWGFLKWVTEGDGPGKTKLGGYAVQSPVVAVIGFSLAAGLLAAALALDKKPPTLAPVAFSTTGLLLAFGVLIGKGSISVGDGGGSPNFGIGIGLILELITLILQVGVLVFGWMTASGRISAHRAPPAWPGQAQQPQPPYPGQPGQPGQPYPGQPVQPGGYAPPHTYGPAQQPPPGPLQGFGPPQQGPGYGPPPGP
jgi:hypothetical protein